MHRLLRRSIVFRTLLLACFVVWSVIASLASPASHGIRTTTFDAMQRHRLWASAPDPRLLIVDVDERSLAELAPEFGRWPWPRDTLAAVLAGSEAAGAEAVVFDILFSDPDRSHPGGDRAFEAAVRKSSRSFFTVVRLPRQNDAKSALFVHEVPGLALPGAGPAGTVAVVLPFMQAILDTRRLGMSTVTPDDDGVLRSFAWAEPHGSWRLVSLPFAVAAGLVLAGRRLPRISSCGARGRCLSARVVRRRLAMRRRRAARALPRPARPDRRSRSDGPLAARCRVDASEGEPCRRRHPRHADRQRPAPAPVPRRDAGGPAHPCAGGACDGRRDRRPDGRARSASPPSPCPHCWPSSAMHRCTASASTSI